MVRLRRDVQSACTITVTCTYNARCEVFIHISARHCYYSHYRCEPCEVKHDVVSADTELWLLVCNRLRTAEEVQARDALRQTGPGIKDNAGIWQTGTSCDFITNTRVRTLTSRLQEKKNNEHNGCSSDVQTSINTALPFASIVTRVSTWNIRGSCSERRFSLSKTSGPALGNAQPTMQ